MHVYFCYKDSYFEVNITIIYDQSPSMPIDQFVFITSGVRTPASKKNSTIDQREGDNMRE
jgi:hypothetical protein